MRDSTIEGSPPRPNATGVITRFDLRETVRLAQLMQLDLQNLFIVKGSSSYDRYWAEPTSRELAMFSGNPPLNIFAVLALYTLMRRLTSLTHRSVLPLLYN